MSSLREVQAAFAAALHGDLERLTPELVGGGIDPAARLQVYRHNAGAVFESALARTYPVVQRRVGEDYFRQLARTYRAAHASPSADLHWVGRDFPAFLADHLAGSAYAWLTDLARLEWACEEALVAADAESVGVDALAGVPADALASLRFTLHPSTRCVRSEYPIFTVWRANQDTAAPPVDLRAGAEHVVLRSSHTGLELYSRPAAEVQLVAALGAGTLLGETLEGHDLTAEALRDFLAWLFAAGFVVKLARMP